MSKLEYNTQRPPLILPEYGRNLQKMVEKILKIEDREKRTAYAYQIIDIMVQLHPNAKDSPELRHKLWDHLYMMSGFKLDVDSPYPKPNREVLKKRPRPLSYNQSKPKYSFYGRNIELLISRVAEMEDGTEKDILIRNIANQMKKAYLLWNKDSVEDSLIAKHLFELSGGKISLSENFQLKSTNEILNQQGGTKKKQKSKKNSKKKSKH